METVSLEHLLTFWPPAGLLSRHSSAPVFWNLFFPHKLSWCHLHLYKINKNSIWPLILIFLVELIFVMVFSEVFWWKLLIILEFYIGMHQFPGNNPKNYHLQELLAYFPGLYACLYLHVGVSENSNVQTFSSVADLNYFLQWGDSMNSQFTLWHGQWPQSVRTCTD